MSLTSLTTKLAARATPHSQSWYLVNLGEYGVYCPCYSPLTNKICLPPQWICALRQPPTHSQNILFFFCSNRFGMWASTEERPGRRGRSRPLFPPAEGGILILPHYIGTLPWLWQDPREPPETVRRIILCWICQDSEDPSLSFLLLCLFVCAWFGGWCVFVCSCLWI